MTIPRFTYVSRGTTVEFKFGTRSAVLEMIRGLLKVLLASFVPQGAWEYTKLISQAIWALVMAVCILYTTVQVVLLSVAYDHSQSTANFQSLVLWLLFLLYLIYPLTQMFRKDCRQ
jgi:hypothetical protein